MKVKMEDMAQEFGDMLKETLDRMRERIEVRNRPTETMHKTLRILFLQPSSAPLLEYRGVDPKNSSVRRHHRIVLCRRGW